MKKILLSLVITCLCVSGYLSATEKNIFKKEKSMSSEIVEETPQYLYKILSPANWNASQKRSSLVLSPDDDLFIHFSKEDQLERITTKYWANTSYVLLKIETSKLPGTLVFEANAGGSSAKYYHLYDGSIPLSAVVEQKTVEVAQQLPSPKTETQLSH